MAYEDALFQLGMDLTRSSTTQTEDLTAQTNAARDEARKDRFIERNGVKFAGTHLIVDLAGASRLDDLAHIEDTLKKCVEVAGATLLHVHVHRRSPNGGISGVAVLDESHISFHSWPETGFAAFDVFLRSDAEPYRVIDVLRQAFAARQVSVKEHLRGEDIATPARKAVVKTVPRLVRVRKVA